MVDTARFFMDFIQDESCGKCTLPRRHQALAGTLHASPRARAAREDLDMLEELGGIIKDTAMCGLGQTAPNPVLSTMKNFRDEYEAHVFDGKCPAGVCTALVQYRILEDKCIGCTACARACPVEAISGVVKQTHHIDPESA